MNYHLKLNLKIERDKENKIPFLDMTILIESCRAPGTQMTLTLGLI